MKRLCCFILGVVLLSACGSVTKELPEKSEVQYEITSFRTTSSPDCEEARTCAIYEVTYPVFFGIDTVVSHKIQTLIDASFAMGDPDAGDKSLQHIATDFVANFKEFSEEFTESMQGWYYNGQANVNVIEDTLISIGVDEEYYTGGAHGGTGRYFINIDPRNGKEYSWKEFFDPAFEENLHALGEKIFRQQRQLADTASLQQNYFEFPENTFRLNDNYGWTPDGIVFYFNNYEVAPYAAGPTEVLIPMEKIKGWLRVKPAL